jgi:hypothetical protein
MARQQKDGRWMRGFADRLAGVLVTKHRSDFELGRMIDECAREELWFDWPTSDGGPYKTFADWSWNALHFKVGKATALRRIFLDLTALRPSEDVISRALRIGWTKLYLILRAARSADALEKWLARVEDHKLTELDLRVETMEVKPEERKRPKKRGKADETSSTGADSPDADVEENEGESSAATPLPERAPIPDPTLANETNGDGEPPADENPTRRYKWPLVFEDVESLRIFKEGLKVVARRYPDIGPGRGAALIATHYMASCARDDEGGAAVELNTIIESIERTYGVTLKVERAAPSPPARKSRAEAARDF